MFLRLYGRNLSRTYRKNPQQALDDAVTQTNTALVFLCGSVLVVLLAWLNPQSLRTSDNPIYWVIIVILVPLLFVVRRDLRKYGSDPRAIEGAEEFRSDRNRRITTLGFYALPFICIGLVVFAFHVIGQ